jgi:hypothetical protein
VVLRIPGDQGLCRARENPHEAHRHRGHQGHEPWFGQEYLKSCAVGGIRALPVEPGDAARILGRECREGLQQLGWRTVGLRFVRPGH